jgi:hypothetical protein
MVAALAPADGHVLHTICRKAPEQNPTVLSILRGFRAAGVTVEAITEPSGTSGDVLRDQLKLDACIPRVHGQRQAHPRRQGDLRRVGSTSAILPSSHRI